MDRKAKAFLHKELIDLLLKDVQNDNEFFSRLLYALQIISNELNRFDEKSLTNNLNYAIIISEKEGRRK